MDTLTVEIEIPDWVRWIAVDKNGLTEGYSIRPEPETRWWLSRDESVILYRAKPPKNWKDELYTWG